MAQLIVRDLEPDVTEKLRRRAAEHGCSMEEEVRAILREAVQREPAPKGLGSRIAARFATMGLAEDENIPELRGYPIKPAEFDEC